MFTGIVEDVGTVRALRRDGGAVLTVDCAEVVADADVGDSISVNGCCLTVSAVHADGGRPSGFSADLMGETLERSTLGALSPGTPVNLERAVRASDRLGGHLVQGHVDAVAEVVAVTPERDWTSMTFTLPEAVAAQVVEKGSVAVDGVSLTVTAVGDGRFSVGLIPHTLAATVLGRRVVGDRVNVEGDVIAKYVERLLRARPPARLQEES